MTPIDIRPSPRPSQAPRGSACKISTPYVAPFRRLSCENAKATLKYCIQMCIVLSVCNVIWFIHYIQYRNRNYTVTTEIFTTLAYTLGPLVPVADQPGRRTLRSGGTNRLMVPSVRRSTVGDRAFTVAGPRVWNTLPEEITTSQTVSTFRQQLKTWLFRKSYPDIIIWTFLLQTINLEVALLHRQFLIDWLIDWLTL